MIFKFSPSEIDQACAKIRNYAKGDASYVIEIHRAKDKRSLNQNRYYWGIVVGLISQTTGYTPSEAHQELGKMFLQYTKENRVFIRSTTDLNTAEAEKYFEDCRLWAWHELNIKIPLPNELTEEMYMQLQNIYKY